MPDFEIKRIGYGQVEPNQLSAQKTGQIYASLKLDPEVDVLQNGEFMFYSYVDNMVTAQPTVEGQEPMLVFNEIKIYEDYLMLKDFAMIRVGDNYVTNRPAIGNITSANTDGTVYGDGSLTKGASIKAYDPTVDNDEIMDPEKDDVEVVLEGHTEYGYRMDGIAPRVFKTNIGDIYTTNMVEEGEYAVGDVLSPKFNEDTKTLVLSADGDLLTKWVVVKCYTMPDGQPGVKLQRIA